MMLLRDRNSRLRTLSACIVYLALLVSGVPAGAADAEPGPISAFETSLRPAVSVQGQPETRWTLRERMEHWKVPGVSIAVIRDGKIAWAKGYGVLQAGGKEAIDTETVFSVGSTSKVGAAAITLRLVDSGQLDLDRDVNGYLRNWKVPQNPYTAVQPVTLRGILSHTAGLTVHGFADFQPGETLPTTVEILQGRAPAKNQPVEVFYTPGSRSQYSGGGTTVEQLIIEEATGLDFPAAARRYLFEPLGMTRSTYENTLPERWGNIAKAHGPDGEPRALPRGYEAMPEMAASGLWTTPSDYARMVVALIHSYQGTGGFLSGPLARQMMMAVGPSRFGLGPILSGEGMSRRFSHSGANDSYRAWMEGHLATGNGVVIFTNGANGGALYAEVRRAIAGAEGWGEALRDQVEAPAVKFTEAEFTERAGVYALERSIADASLRFGAIDQAAVQIVAREGALYRRSIRGEDRLFPLTPLDAAHFYEARSNVVYEFVRDPVGKVSAMVVHRERDKRYGRRVSEGPEGDTLPIDVN